VLRSGNANKVTVVNRRLHLSSRKQIEPREDVGCDKHKQANSRESENGPKSRSHLPVVALTLGNRGSNASDRGLQQRGGDGESDKIQPRNFTDAHRCRLYRGKSVT
jgi:hypothetical protein